MKKIFLLFIISLLFSFKVNASESYIYNLDGLRYTIYITSSYAKYATVSGHYTNDKDVIVIPDSVEYQGEKYEVRGIEDYALGHHVLQSISLPKNLRWIGYRAFNECCNLMNITFPNLLTSIKSEAFMGCSGLKSISLPNSLTSIGSSAFKGCTGLSNIVFSNMLTSLESATFEGCTGLKSISLPNSIKSIGSSAFKECTGLSNIVFSDSLTSIETEAFKGCKGLTHITIPYSVISIGAGAFDYCEDLFDVTCLAVTPPNMKNYRCFYPAYFFATLHVPQRSLEIYKATDWWSSFNIIKGDAEDSSTSTYIYYKCDTNGDGEVNIADVNLVIDVILSQ